MASRRWNLPSSWNRTLQVSLGAVGVCVFLLLGLLFGWTAQIGQGIVYGWSWAGTGVRSLYETVLTSRATVQGERDYYQTLAGTLAKDAADAATLREEMKNLEDALGYIAHATQQPLLARILGRSNDPEAIVFVDQGTEDGIQQGDAAFIHDGHLVGIIDRTWNHYARIRLTRDANSHIPASILGQEEQTIGIVDGQNGYLLRMRFIPHDQPIAVGQVVITSGLDGHLPAGLVLGTVSEIIQEERALFQEALIQPIFSLDQETRIFLIPQAIPPSAP